MAAQQQFEMKRVPLEVRVEPRAGMRNLTRMAIEEWVWRNGGEQRGGLLRCRFVERRATPIIFMSMSEIHQNQWLMEMVQTTPFDGQLMVCGPENFISCWAPTPGQVPPARPNQAQQQPAPEQPAAAPVPIMIRPNVTINLNADRILRGIIGRGRMMRRLQGPVPNQEQLGAAIPIESEDEDQAFVDVVAELEQ